MIRGMFLCFDPFAPMECVQSDICLYCCVTKKVALMLVCKNIRHQKRKKVKERKDLF